MGNERKVRKVTLLECVKPIKLNIYVSTRPNSVLKDKKTNEYFSSLRD